MRSNITIQPTPLANPQYSADVKSKLPALTYDGIQDDLNNIKVLRSNSRLITDQFDRTHGILSRLTDYCIGDPAYENLYTATVSFVMTQGGSSGIEMVERLQNKLPDTLHGKHQARNDVIPRLQQSGLFNLSKDRLEARYDRVSGLLNTVVKDQQNQARQIYKANQFDLLMEAEKAFDGPPLRSTTVVHETLEMLNMSKVSQWLTKIGL